MELFARGIDPRTAFSRERFYGSHDGVVRAVVGGVADVAATYANVDPTGRAARGVWSRLPGAGERLRVLARFDPGPNDVVALRSELAQGGLLDSVRGALLSLTGDLSGSSLVHRIFGIDAFEPWSGESYEPLYRAVNEAVSRGLLAELVRS
jgi:ABC-type phosphate/phosphonate transport system substrate-binding protein